MKDLVEYFENISAECKSKVIEHDNKNIPKQLIEFYNTFDGVDLPFGRIYELELAMRNSSRVPFHPDWFVFGQDNYSSFWLCYKNKSEDGCYFTYWDHESGLEIEEPVWTDLLSFLKEMEEYSEEED